MFNNGHFQTLLPYFLRRAPKLDYERERITTPDNDFLDLDWICSGSKKLVILSHGLESSSQAKYIKGMAKSFQNVGYDVLAWNYRGCSGEINLTVKYYHSGATYDLDRVICHVLDSEKYEEVVLVGFSLGGNLTLKYLGESNGIIDPRIRKGVAISAPVCLNSSSHKLKSGFNKVYTKAFLKTLKKKVYAKSDRLREIGLDPSRVENLTDLPEFDDVFTAPLHGFIDANDYYKKSSSKQFITEINIPTLILNAKNDPFLSDECFPFEEAKNNDKVTLLVPHNGGHVGFYSPLKKEKFISEKVVLDFVLD